MSTRRAELFATLARTFAELAELEGAAPVEITAPLPVAPPPSKPRQKALRLAPPLPDDRPVDPLARKLAQKTLRRLGIPT